MTFSTIIKSLCFASIILIILRPSNDTSAHSDREQFSQELKVLKDYFHIPGMSILVKQGDQVLYENYLGYSSIADQTSMDAETTIPMASLTKIFSAVLLMQLVEEEKLSLDDLINRYIKDQNIDDHILIKHVLSHTSQGIPGEKFYYSGRFSWLTTVLEKASRTSFESLIEKKIVAPLDLKYTYLLKDAAQLALKNYKIAKPYQYQGSQKEGRFEYGFSTSAGITSTVCDLAIFDNALDENRLINATSKAALFKPFQENLPYGQGIFNQTFLGKELIWGYGQYDYFSSLYLKVPEKNLTLILAANNNLMSDPARLIYGDISYSLFALSFLKNFVFDLSDIPILEKDIQKDDVFIRSSGNSQRDTFYQYKLGAEAIAASFMAPFEPKKSIHSKMILKRLFNAFPDYKDYGDLTLLHNLLFLKAIDLQTQQPYDDQFDTIIKTIGEKLLVYDPDNPYTNFYMASFYDGIDKKDLSRSYYEQIVNASNFSPGWYTQVAKNWLTQHPPD